MVPTPFVSLRSTFPPDRGNRPHRPAGGHMGPPLRIPTDGADNRKHLIRHGLRPCHLPLTGKALERYPPAFPFRGRCPRRGRMRYPLFRTRHVGSATPGAVVESHQLQFSKNPGPSGPAGIQTLTQSLRAGNVLPTPRGNPRNGGPRGNLAWRTRRYAEVLPCKFPLASFGSFSTGKRNSPRRANPL